jgi:crossover junction endodeoxyribonuclease RuvC
VTARRTILGLDLSLTSTGACRIQLTPHPLAPQDVTVHLQRVTSKAPTPPKGDKNPTLAQTSIRLRKLAGQITALAVGADLVLVEAPALSRTSGHAHDRSGLWWLVVARLTGAGLNVVEVQPGTVKTYAVGKGGGVGADKDAVLAAVVLRYQKLATVTSNDEADALVLAAMGARWIGQPIEDSLPQTHSRALKAVRWQPTT